MQAIETPYKGYRFRSRLEARWAVFFDTIGIEYKYEDEGFDLGDGIWYLPDFFVPKANCFIEIKPEIPKLVEYDDGIQIVESQEYTKCRLLAEQSGKCVLLIGGQPWLNEISIGDYTRVEYEYGIAVFAPAPQDTDIAALKGSLLPFLFIYDEYGYSRISKNFYSSDQALFYHISVASKTYPEFFEFPIPARGETHALVSADKRYFERKNGREHPFWYYGFAESGFHFSLTNGKVIVGCDTGNERVESRMWQALEKARAARFEQGNGA